MSFSVLSCRNLADNWNIDIAAELDQYLAELQSITLSIDGGKTSIDFVTGLSDIPSVTLISYLPKLQC